MSRVVTVPYPAAQPVPYAYFVPNYNNAGYFGKVARVNLGNFTAGGVTVLDLTTVDAALKGFYGGFTDGTYAYFVPNYNNAGYFGKVARVSLSDFTGSGVTVLDLTTVDAGLKGFAGGFTDALPATDIRMRHL